MPQTEHSPASTARFDKNARPSACSTLEGDTMPKGLILNDGRIAATARRMLETLGFSPDDDLRGLSFGSFWHHLERPAALDALRRARNGEEAEVSMDLGYIHGRDGHCTVTLTSAGAGGLVLMTLAYVTMNS